MPTRLRWQLAQPIPIDVGRPCQLCRRDRNCPGPRRRRRVRTVLLAEKLPCRTLVQGGMELTLRVPAQRNPRRRIRHREHSAPRIRRRFVDGKQSFSVPRGVSFAWQSSASQSGIPTGLLVAATPGDPTAPLTTVLSALGRFLTAVVHPRRPRGRPCRHSQVEPQHQHVQNHSDRDPGSLLLHCPGISFSVGSAPAATRVEAAKISTVARRCRDRSSVTTPTARESVMR